MTSKYTNRKKAKTRYNPDLLVVTVPGIAADQRTSFGDATNRGFKEIL